jgi:hypothetical protein
VDTSHGQTTVAETPPGLTAADLDRFRAVQQLAYGCAEAVDATLTPGVTEREAARAMRAWLTERGVDDWFHLPFAWFGDRTAFEGFRLPTQFFPTNRRLEQGMPFILDVAPIVDGYTADIGYASALGDNPIQSKLLDDLEPHRELVLEGVRARRSLRDVYDDVDRLFARQGYDNRHRKYPGGVIAHRVFSPRKPSLARSRVDPSGDSSRIGLRGSIIRGPVRGRTAAGFGLRSLRVLAKESVAGRRQGWSPLWGGTKASDHPPTPGLWAVEPHLGFRGVGAKFEELLVVTEHDAYWLDDDLPHVRRWRAAATA